MAKPISVEVVLADSTSQLLVNVVLECGATAGDAIERSGIAGHFPNLDVPGLAVGIWGHVVDREHRLAEGDRVELYRPLQIEPRDARRQLALSGRTMSAPDAAED